MRKRFVLIVLVALLLASFAGYTGYFAFTKSQDEQVETAKVTRVIDGDTIEIETGERVRLLGINTPEKNEFYYSEAKDKLSGLVGGKSVRLESDVEDKDKYGRLLRYLFVGDTFVNLEMLKEGHATFYMFDPDGKYYGELKDVEAYAKENKLGLWIEGETACIKIVLFNYDASGDDNKNLNDEYVTFRNVCENPIDMSGWTVKDEGTNSYAFEKFSIGKGSDFTLHTGKGTDSADEIYWNSNRAIWNNAGDTLFLRDTDGSLVLSYKYP